jgi:predicted SprT family Zn-dependent metalloprotease
MPKTTPRVENYKDLRQPIIPEPLACINCHGMYGQKYRVDKNDKSKGYVCNRCIKSGFNVSQ